MRAWTSTIYQHVDLLQLIKSGEKLLASEIAAPLLAAISLGGFSDIPDPHGLPSSLHHRQFSKH